MRHDGGMLRWSVRLAVAAYLAGAVLQVVQSATLGFADPLRAVVPTLVLLALPVAVGGLVAWRVPGSPVGAALAWLGAAPTLVFAVETWGESARSARPWPGAAMLYQVQMGAWVLNVAGFAALCLVFPDGLLPGRRWRVVAWGAVAAAVFVNALLALVGLERDHQPVTLPPGWLIVVAGLGFLACLATLSATVASLVVRYRSGNATVRQQLRWLMLGAGNRAGAARRRLGAAESSARPRRRVPRASSPPCSSRCRPRWRWRSCGTTCSTSTGCSARRWPGCSPRWLPPAVFASSWSPPRSWRARRVASG